MNKEIEFLKELQDKLKTQDKDGQASPRFWTIMDYRHVATEEGYHDRVVIFFPGRCECATVEEYVQDISSDESEREFTDEQIDDLNDCLGSNFFEFEDYEAVLDWAKENDDEDAYFVHERRESFIVPNTMFLVKEEAKKHLQLNKHHYTEDAHTYAMTAWRSPSVGALFNILETFDWDSLSK